MTGCPPITLTGVTDAAWQCLRNRALAVGIRVAGDSGSASAQGASVEYHRDPETHTLTVTITQLPGWADCAMVTTRLREAAAGCGAS